MEDISFYFLLLLLKALNDYRLSLHEWYRDACSRTMNFEVTVTFTHIIFTAVTRKLSRYRNSKPYPYYNNFIYNILWERFLSIRQTDTKLFWRKVCSSLNMRSVKITWRTIGAFCFPFFSLLIRLVWSRVAILSTVLVNYLFIIRPETFFFSENKW